MFSRRFLEVVKTILAAVGLAGCLILAGFIILLGLAVLIGFGALPP